MFKTNSGRRAMPPGIRRALACTCSALFAFSFAASVSANSFVQVTDFAKTGNMQAKLQASFPSGAFTAGNSFGTPFEIASDSNGNNFAEVYSPLTIHVGVFGATNVDVLMNAYSPISGETLATVEFIGSAGADETFSLVNGTDVRDFYQDGFANSVDGTTTQNAFIIHNVYGGAGTGNVSTGAYGTYLIDEHQFDLSPVFAAQTLSEINITPGQPGSGSALLFALTAQVAAAPLPSSAWAGLALFGGLALSGIFRKSRRADDWHPAAG